MSELTSQQQRFVEEYAVDANGTQAAIRAGYSPSSARSRASRLLAKDNIQQAIIAQGQERSEQRAMDNQAIEQTLVDYVNADMRQVMRLTPAGPVLIDGANIPDEVARAIESISMTKFGPVVKLVSKAKAIELLGRFRGMDKPRVDPAAQNEKLTRRVKAIKPEMAALRDEIMEQEDDADADRRASA